MSESVHTLTFDEFAFANYNDKTKNDHTSQIVNLNEPLSSLMCRFAQKANPNWGLNRISKMRCSISVSAFTAESYTTSARTSFLALESAFSPSTMTYNTKPKATTGMFTYIHGPGRVYSEYMTPQNYDYRGIFDYGVEISVRDAALCNVYTPANSALAPAVEITTDDTDFVRIEAYYWDNTYGGKTRTMSSGADVVLSGIYTRPNGLSYTVPTQTGIAAIWRSDEGGEEHEIPMTDPTAQSLVIPVDTFGGLKQVQVRPKITTNNILTWIPDTWLTIKLEDATPVAVPTSPVGEPVNKDDAIVFHWNHVISTGSAQTKADLQRSTDGKTWSALATVTGAATIYTAPANTFASGTNFWRVRTYNADGIAGEWSAQAEFICIGAPDAPVVTIAADSPRPAVAWQVDGQLAYQVELAGQPVSSVYYGTEKTWTCPTYLQDGAYTVRVRVQNEYGLWSPWGETALQVVNVPGAAIALTVDADDAARLTWQTTGSYDFFLIYRDGRLIGRTTERSFTDAASIGAVRYQVRGCYGSSANYGLSPEIAATVAVQYVTLSDMDTGAILPLPYSESAHRTTSRTRKQEIQAVQLAGRAYPVIERSEHMAQSISVACAFYTQEDCAALEEMLGHLVTVRTPEGRMITGCLAQLTERTDGGFYSVYTFSVDQADWEEAIRIDA